jgi:hypothetical protein
MVFGPLSLEPWLVGGHTAQSHGSLGAEDREVQMMQMYAHTHTLSMWQLSCKHSIDGPIRYTTVHRH